MPTTVEPAPKGIKCQNCDLRWAKLKLIRPGDALPVFYVCSACVALVVKGKR